MNFPIFSLGSIVSLKAEFLGEPPGTRAVVYELYGMGGISIITENGVNLGGFSFMEQAEYLNYYSDIGKVYIFKNVMQLADDFRAGVFNEFFAAPQIHLKNT